MSGIASEADLGPELADGLAASTACRKSAIGEQVAALGGTGPRRTGARQSTV